MKTRRTSAEKIADLLGADIADIKQSRYQPSVYVRPAVFTVGDDYYAASDSMPPYVVGQTWQRLTNWRGETIWRSECAS